MEFELLLVGPGLFQGNPVVVGLAPKPKATSFKRPSGRSVCCPPIAVKLQPGADGRLRAPGITSKSRTLLTQPRSSEPEKSSLAVQPTSPSVPAAAESFV
jgi:hypothetical protein